MMSSTGLPAHHAANLPGQAWSARRPAWLYEAVLRGADSREEALTTTHLGWIDLRGGLRAAAGEEDPWALEHGRAEASHPVWGMELAGEKSQGGAVVIGFAGTPIIRWELGLPRGTRRPAITPSYDEASTPGSPSPGSTLQLGAYASVRACTQAGAVIALSAQRGMAVVEVDGATPVLVVDTTSTPRDELPCWIGYDAAGGVSMILLDLGGLPDSIQAERDQLADADRFGRARPTSWELASR